MEHKGTAKLETTRLILRPFVPEDVNAVFGNWANDPDVTKYLTWNAHENRQMTKTVLQDWISKYISPDFYHWAIVPKARGQPIGTISAVRVYDDTEQIEAGYCIGKKWWHQGLTSEAFACVLAFWFEQVHARRIEACHHAENLHSGDVMRKCGLQYEGKLRQINQKDGASFETCIYSILAEQYQLMHLHIIT